MIHHANAKDALKVDIKETLKYCKESFEPNKVNSSVSSKSEECAINSYAGATQTP